jgi:recombination protein RecA
MSVPPAMKKFRQKLDSRYGARLTTLVENPVQYEIISTGSITLDLATGVGGLVRGRTHEFVGPPGVCKTTLSILAAAEHQRVTKKAVGWIDMEQSFDFEWAASLGLDTSERMLTHIYPDDAEDVSDMLKMMSQSELYGIIVIDSIGGMESRKAFEKDADGVTMGRNAQVITRMVKLAASEARKNNITVLYINQLRANLSGMAGAADIAAGPKALQYNTTMSIKLYRKGSSKGDTVQKIGSGDDEHEIGRVFVAKVMRSRVSPQGKQAAVVGIRTGVIKVGGAYYTPPGYEKGLNGRPRLVAALKKDPVTVELIRKEALALVADTITEETVMEEIPDE